MTVDTESLRAAISNAPTPFELRKIGHVVLMVTDLKRSVAFYTGVLGFKVSDIYGDDMMPGGMVFMRCNPDHHGVALIGGAPGPSKTHELHHMAFEVGSLDEVLRARKHLRESGATIVFDGRRRAGVQIAVEFLDPDGHNLEIYWGLDQVGTRRRNGAARNPSKRPSPTLHRGKRRWCRINRCWSASWNASKRCAVTPNAGHRTPNALSVQHQRLPHQHVKVAEKIVDVFGRRVFGDHTVYGLGKALAHVAIKEGAAAVVLVHQLKAALLGVLNHVVVVAVVDHVHKPPPSHIDATIKPSVAYNAPARLSVTGRR
jgi:catechol 2,3-dioxygenase